MSNKRRARNQRAAPHAMLKPGVYVLNIQHDDGCPTIHTQQSSDCTCSKVDKRLVNAETYWKEAKKDGGH